MRHGVIAGVGALITLLAAPFAAVADAPFRNGGTDALPLGWASFRQRFLPLLTFASDDHVLSVWHLAAAAGLAAIVVAGAGLIATARPVSRLSANFCRVAVALLFIHTAGIVLGSVAPVSAVLRSVGLALYLPTTLLAPVVTSLAGAACLRTRALPRLAGWTLLLAPLILLLAMATFKQVPGGTAPGLAMPWALATLLVDRAPRHS